MRARAQGHAHVLVAQAAVLDGIDDEFAGVIQRLHEADHKRALEQLQEKVGKLGLAGLSGDEKEQYRQLLRADADADVARKL